MANKTIPAIQTNEGNVGIGITNPVSKLHVSGAAATIMRLDAETLTSVAQFQAKASTDGVLIAGMYGPNPVAGTIFGANTSGAAFLGTTTLATVHPTLLAIGTSNTIPIIFGTNGIERMRLDSVGGISIGTPSQLNSSRVSIADSALKTSAGNCLTFATATAGSNDFQLIISRGSNTNGYYAFQAVEQGVGYKNIVFNQDGGNVGIGTTNPANKLVVYDNKDTSTWNSSANSDLSNIQIHNAQSTINRPAVIELVQNDHSVVRLVGYKTDATSYWLSNFGISVRKADTNMHQVFTAQYDGNIGIGSTTPGAKLDVVGNINIDGSSFHRIANDSIITAPSDHGLVAYYGFDEGSSLSISDKTGRNNTSALGLTYTTTAIRGTALDGFGGNDNYVIVPDSTDFDFGTGDFAVSLWCRPNGSFTGTNNTLIEIGLYTAGILIRPQSAFNTLEVYIQSVFVTGPTIVWAANVWYHIVVTRISSVLNVYSNGTRIASVANGSNIQVSSAGYIGRSAHAVGQFFYGIIDEVKIYKGKGLDYGEVRGQYLSRGDSTLVAPIFSNTNGNVGIGKTNPRVLLDLAKANNVAQVLLLGETSANIRVGFGLDPSNAVMRIFSYNQITDGGIEFGGISSDGSTWTRNHRLGLAAGNSFFNQQGGNVGIGTTNPNAKLDSYFASNALTFNYLATNLDGNSPIPAYAFDVTDGSLETRSIKAGIGYQRYLSNGRGVLHFYNRSTDTVSNIQGSTASIGDIRMSIDNNGNVGIGTVTPTSKLHVVETTPTGSRIQLGSISTSALMNTNLVNDFLILTAPFNAVPASTSNNNAKWGIKMGGGSVDAANALEKSACIYAVSEEDAVGGAGYNRKVGLALHTSPFDLPNVERVRINNLGNVGIGTTAPTALLNIRASVPAGIGSTPAGTNLLIDSNTSNYITFRNTSDNGTYAGLLFLDNNIGGYIAFGNAGATAGSDSMIYGAYQDHIFQNGYVNETLYNRTETMRIKQNGYVGIGITNPSAKLQVVQSNAAGVAAILLSSDESTIQGPSANTQIRMGSNLVLNGSNILTLGTNNVTRMVIDVTGNVGIGTLAPTAQNNYKFLQVNGTTAAIIEAMVNNVRIGGIDSDSSSLYFGSIGSFPIVFRTAVVEKMRITAAGLVGIGTATPTTLLSVGGAGSTLPASGITFGGDAVTNLYRIAADTLKTDANLQIVRSLELRDVFYHYSNIRFLNKAGSNWLTWFTRNTSESEAVSRLDYIRSINTTSGGNLGIGTNTPSGKLHVVSSISNDTVLRADGTNGTLFSVVDDLSDSLMSVNNSAGLPVLEVFADDRVVAGQYGSGDFVLINNKVGLGTSNPANKLSVIGGASIGSSTYNTSAPSNGLIVEGNVGVGTTNPVSKLHVKSSTTQDGIMIDSATYSEVAFRINGGATKSFLSLSSVAGGYIIGSSANALIIRNDSDIFMSADAGVTSAITIKNGGNIGIGLTNPAYKLQVSGDVSIAGANVLRFGTVAVLNTASSPNDIYANIRVLRNESTVNTDGMYIGYNNNGTTAGHLRFYANAANERMRIQANDGFVGIGTDTAAGRLDVYSSGNTDHVVFIRNLHAGVNAFSSLQLRRDGNTNGLVMFTNSSTRTTDGGAGNSTIRTDNGKLLVGAGATTYHSFETNGDVGIGLTNPSAARLHIKGDGSNPVLRVETADLQSAVGGTASKTFAGWLPIMTGAAGTDKVFIPLFK